jgi:hypothetical protein
MLLIYSTPPLLLPDDFDWLIGQLQSKTNPSIQQALAALIARLFRANNPDQFQVVYDLVQRNSFLATSLYDTIGYIELHSAEADELRANHRRWQELEQRREQLRMRRQPDRLPADVLQQHLDGFEAGDVDAWWRINHILRFEADGGSPHGVLQVDLRLLPGWIAADEETQVRIVQAAQRHLPQAHDDPDQWRLPEGYWIYPPAYAAYRALYLLLHVDRPALSRLSSDVWERWAAIIVGYLIFGGTENKTPHHILTALAYHYAPDAVIAALLYEIDKDNRNGHRPSALDKFEHCWDDRLTTVLLEKARDPMLTATCLKALLEALFEHRPGSELEGFVINLVASPPSQDAGLQRRRMVAARVLMTSASNGGWSTVWPVFQADPAFGRELIESLAHLDDRSAPTISAHLTEDQLAELYIWVTQQFPHREDPVDDLSSMEFHSVTSREKVGRLRDGLLMILKNKGTPVAVQVLQRIQVTFPELDWLRWTLLEAQAITRRATWTPLTPSELLALAQNSSARLVQNGKQFLDVLLDSLERLQSTLRDETPTVFRFWNEAPVYRPKDEERLSDEIKSHLQIDLEQRRIVVNREVVIRPTIEGFQGERLDLKVQAISGEADGQPGNVITAIIEVKGCWNRELPEAMQTQLANRYLYQNTCQHGLYFIGWFNCAAWDEKDYRRGRAEALAPSLADARAQFAGQAEMLSGSERIIRAFVLDASLPQNNRVRPADQINLKKPRSHPKKVRPDGNIE